jgi:hypothetical protein
MIQAIHHTTDLSTQPTTPNQPHPHSSNNREDAAEQRKAVTSAEELNQDVVGGNIPRTLLKLLTYCRVSDKATCEVLLELGKVKVNGEVCDSPVELVRPSLRWLIGAAGHCVRINPTPSNPLPTQTQTPQIPKPPNPQVDLVKDQIEFAGEPVTLPETRLKHKLRSLDAGADAEENVPKDYCARIDGGLLIDLTRNIEKARGTFIDKSPYIMRNNNGGGGGPGGRS